MIPGESDPLTAWHWDIRTGRLSTYEFPRPATLSHGDRQEALDAWGFQTEFAATSDSHAPRVMVYTRFLPEDVRIMPFHYCIVLEMSSYYELVFAADLPEVVDALRYLAPIIGN